MTEMGGLRREGFRDGSEMGSVMERGKKKSKTSIHDNLTLDFKDKEESNKM